jgi:hypothetical protein
MMQMKNPPHPGQLVRHELDELGIPVAEAAAALGVTRQALYNVISGDQPRNGRSPRQRHRQHRRWLAADADDLRSCAGAAGNDHRFKTRTPAAFGCVKCPALGWSHN